MVGVAFICCTFVAKIKYQLSVVTDCIHVHILGLLNFYSFYIDLIGPLVLQDAFLR